MNQCRGQVGELCRRDVRAASLEGGIRNASAAGGDGITTEQVKTAPSAFLDELKAQLRKPRLVQRRAATSPGRSPATLKSTGEVRMGCGVAP